MINAGAKALLCMGSMGQQAFITQDECVKIAECAVEAADLSMLRKIKLNPDFSDFEIYYSGLDNFDIVYPWGLGYMLGGMPTCTPNNSKALIECMDAGDKSGAAKALNNIIYYRRHFA